MHADRAEFDETESDPLAVRVVSIVQGYRLSEFIKQLIAKPFAAKFDPDDVMQDVMLLIVNSSEPEEVFRMHNTGELRAWLNSLIRRTLGRNIRKLSTKKRRGGRKTHGETEIQDRSRPSLLDVVYDDDEARSPSSEEAAIEAKYAMLAALYSLPVLYRLALTLHYLKGIPHIEMAKIMGDSLGAVRGLLQRGVRILRGRMGPADQWFSSGESGDYLGKILGEHEGPTDDDNS